MLFYQLALLTLSPIISLLLWQDSRKRQGGAQYLSQRHGRKYPQIKPQATWLHCASVGEVNAIKPLIKARPNHNWLITVNTPTGYRTAQKLNPTNLTYLPFDFPWAVKNFLKQAQPKELLIVETEIWPNLYKQVNRRLIPIKIINARLSEKTLNAPKWLKKLYKKALSRTAQIYARTAEDKQKFILLGADPNKLQVLGNIKYAAFTQNLPNHPYPQKIPDKKYLLLASSHQDEELKIAQVWQELTQELKLDINLIIAPRHIERSDDIQLNLQENQLESWLIDNTSLPLSNTAANKSIAHNNSIIIVKEFGVLLQLYQHAELVIMGGSFAPKGGQNFLEPAAYSRPILIGPNTQDFSDEVKLFVENKAIEVCENYQELKDSLIRLFTNPELQLYETPTHMQQLGQNARKALDSQAEVLDKYLRELNL